MSSSQPVAAGNHKLQWRLVLVPLGYRNFRLVWLGSVTEHVGEFMELATILWLARGMTDSPLLITLVGTARYIAIMFLSVLGGVAADRFSRRNLLITVLLGSSLLSVSLAVLATTGLIAIWHLILISLLHGVFISFNHPARQAMVPNLINREHLLSAVSVDVLSVRGSSAVGMTLGGYVMAALGAPAVFIVRALGCLLSIAWLLMAHIPPTPPVARTQAPLRNLAEGLGYIRTHSLLMILILFFALPYLLLNTYTNFLPIFARDIMNLGPVGYGWLQGAPGIGGIICLIGAGLFTYYPNKFRLLILSGIILGLALLGFSASAWFFPSMVLLIVVGGMNATLVAFNSAIVQSMLPDEVRGRVLSWREIFFGLGPTLSMVFGAIAQYTGVPFSLGLLAGFCILVSLALIPLAPRFRNAG